MTSAFLNALREEGTREDCLKQIERLFDENRRLREALEEIHAKNEDDGLIDIICEEALKAEKKDEAADMLSALADENDRLSKENERLRESLEGIYAQPLIDIIGE